MSLKCAVVVTILLVSVVIMAGCTSTSPAPVASPPPPSVAATVASTPAPAGAPAVVAPPEAQTMMQTTAWTTVPAPVPDHPYSKTYTFEGTGDYTQEFTTDSDRTWVFRMNCPDAEEIFMVTIKDKNFDDVEVLANEGGAYSGTKSVQLAAGKYYLDVASDSPWTITMSTA
jgi:hypothetical protein